MEDSSRMHFIGGDTQVKPVGEISMKVPTFCVFPNSKEGV
jgi:hypothetical protein